MDLRFAPPADNRYTSRSQIARVSSQTWVYRELPCLHCSNQPLRPMAENTRSRDFVCASCFEPYELKCKAGRFSRWVLDGDYQTLLDTIRAERTPNLLLMEYDAPGQTVTALHAVHRTLLSPLAIVPRRPLSLSARRAGWQGCNIDLSTIPADGRVPVVVDRKVVPWSNVVGAWSTYDFMIRLRPEIRGWTRDVLAMIESVPTATFTLAEAYSFERELSRLHPTNRNIRPKIRQQLQLLVAYGVLRRLSPGLYSRVREPG